jgi:hypothetical protein
MAKEPYPRLLQELHVLELREERQFVNATVLIEGRCEMKAASKGTLTASNDWWI